MAVYFIQKTNGIGLIKIGFAHDPHERLSVIQAMCPDRLGLLKIIEGDLAYEATIHRHFYHLRQHGEWFEPEKELFEFINNPISSEVLKRENKQVAPNGYSVVIGYREYKQVKDALERHASNLDTKPTRVVRRLVREYLIQNGAYVPSQLSFFVQESLKTEVVVEDD